MWIKVILQAQNIIKFFKIHSKKIEGLGTISAFSYFDLNTYKSMKEKQNTNDITFNDRKFINSYLYFYRMYNDKHENETHEDVINLDHDHLISDIEEKLFRIYIRQVSHGINVEKFREEFFTNIFYYIYKVFIIYLDTD